MEKVICISYAYRKEIFNLLSLNQFKQSNLKEY